MFSDKSYEDIVQGHVEGDDGCKSCAAPPKSFRFNDCTVPALHCCVCTTGSRQDQVLQCIHNEANLSLGLLSFKKRYERLHFDHKIQDCPRTSYLNYRPVFEWHSVHETAFTIYPH